MIYGYSRNARSWIGDDVFTLVARRMGMQEEQVF